MKTIWPDSYELRGPRDECQGLLSTRSKTKHVQYHDFNTWQFTRPLPLVLYVVNACLSKPWPPVALLSRVHCYLHKLVLTSDDLDPVVSPICTPLASFPQQFQVIANSASQDQALEYWSYRELESW